MAKSADAFRTISEVSDWLETPAHVLRFWESRFTQVKPVKRAGGRRYYRPTDMMLLGGIRRLLHDDGITIKGVQKIMREKGVKYVSSLSLPLPGEDDDQGSVHETTPITEILGDEGTAIAADDRADNDDAFETWGEVAATTEPDDTAEGAESEVMVVRTTKVEVEVLAVETKIIAPEIEDELDDRAFLEQFMEDGKAARDTAVDVAPKDASLTKPLDDRVAAIYQRLLHLRNRMHADMMQG
ncbi:MAG: MerR family transcriptional regulator [Proteobacteria bacterium]|nr:MerR family transcriptional regulator [Pseudomonadota bacterium]